MDGKYDFSETDRKYACNCRLGASYSKSKTEFALWSPYAQQIKLNIYENSRSAAPHIIRPMQMDQKGVWRCTVSGDLDGAYYTYCVTADGITRETPDIYSKSAGANGLRSMIFSQKSVYVKGWENDRPISLSSPSDAVIYELHVRDFSMDENTDHIHRGKFLAFCEDNVTNSYGDSVGADYLSGLGITHVHLLPVMDFASIDETSHKAQFNWGYDPLHYNVPEGSYSSDPFNGLTRVKELRSLVMALHRRGIGVILDVVYNHSFDADDSPFGKIFPHYYYRHSNGHYSNGSGCGNEFASERRMAGRFICDSLCALAEDYHLDGFRFDLMGLTDIGTLNRCAKKLRRINPDILLYGEGWTGGCSPLPEEQRALKHHAEKLDGFAMFSDDIRDGIKGSVFDDRDCGYINGNKTKERRELIKSVMCGGIYHPDVIRPERQCWAKTPLHCINYVESHDNLTFWDKLCLSMPKASYEERLRVNKLGAALVFLAQGIPFIQAGQELLRSKPDCNGGYDHNSYRSDDSVNCIKWNLVTENRSIMEYYKGLIAIRKAYPLFRMTDAEIIRQKLRFEDLSGCAFAMHIDDLILVINPNRRPAAIRLPEGVFDILADGVHAGASSSGECRGKVSAMPQSILLLKYRT
ncbi:MAG: type I pullulanase [Oscillospiraceae bacterium]|nr:type I pullulanase [Oscillospiraceae bacterium]